MKSTKGKRKTLYGRYDDYDLTDPAEDGFDRLSGDWEGAPDEFSDGSETYSARRHENHAMRLTDLAGSGSPSPYRTRRASAPAGAGKAEQPDRTGHQPGRVWKRPDSTEKPPEKPERPDTAGQISRAGRTTAAPRRSRTHEPELPLVSDFAVTRIRADAEGTVLTVTLEGSTADGTRLRREIPVTVEQYAALSLRQGALTPEQGRALMQAGDLCLAVRKGMELLGYGDMSARRMVYKLTARGVTRETAGEAAAWLQAHGLLREDDAALRRAAQDARKLWGPRRILQDLRAQGYSAEAASAALDALTGADLDPDEPLPSDAVDFLINCETAIRKKFGGVPEERDERRKMTAALIRLGYDTDVIREASENVMREE